MVGIDVNLVPYKNTTGTSEKEIDASDDSNKNTDINEKAISKEKVLSHESNKNCITSENCISNEKVKNPEESIDGKEHISSTLLEKNDTLPGNNMDNDEANKKND